MSYYTPKASDDGQSPSSMYFGVGGGFGGGSKDVLEDDLVALIGQSQHGHGMHSHGMHHQSQHHHMSQHQQQPQSPQQSQHQQQQEWRPPVHDIFGTFPSTSYAQHHQDLYQHSLPSPAPTQAATSPPASAGPPPPSGGPPPTTRHRASVTSRSRSRSKQPRSTRGTEATATATSPASTRPIPISLGPLGSLPHIPPTSALHGLAQSLPHSHWSAYLTQGQQQQHNQQGQQNGQHAATPGTPSYLPTPDSYSYHPHSLSAISTLSTSPPPATPKEASPHHPTTDDPVSKQAQIASEKRRRRRESHNAVERRRRDNINEKISELATLIPEIMLDPNAGTPSLGQALFAISSQGSAVAEEGSPGADGQTASALGEDDDKSGMKANKGIILKKSVEYIRYLQQLVTAQATRNSELEAQLAEMRGQPSAPSTNGNAVNGGPGGPDLSAFSFGGNGGPNLFDDLLLASPGAHVIDGLNVYETHHPHGHSGGNGHALGHGHAGIASTSTESDEDMRSNAAADEEERGRARTRSGNLGAGVMVKTEDAMEV